MQAESGAGRRGGGILGESPLTGTDFIRAPIADLRDAKRIDFTPVPDPDGRVEVWTRPRPGRKYVIGADFAYGLEDRDYDAAVVLDPHSDPPEQVAEAHGHWGESFHRILYGLVRLYNGAFVLGERQVGLPTLRLLITEYRHGWIYYDRREDARGRRLTDKLGYWRDTGDVCIPHLRRAVRDKLVLFRSPTLLEQMGRVMYAPRTSMAPEDCLDKDLRIKLAGGGSPDLVLAAAYAWWACQEVPFYPEGENPFARGSLGQILGHNELLPGVKPEPARARSYR